MYYSSTKKTSKLQKFSKWASLVMKHVNVWGHHRLSVMLVPHSEKKIFNFQISNYTVIFSSILITLLIFTSIFAINSQKSTTHKKNVLQNENQHISQKLTQFIALTHELDTRQRDLKQIISILINRSGSSHNNLNELAFPALAGISRDILSAGKNGADTDFMDEIYKLSDVIRKTQRVDSRLVEIQKQINGFKKIMEGIPSIWPIFGGSGIFASGFGQRIDPFTRAPSFHSGVDILAMPGSPIRAAASGTVSAAEFHPGNGIYVNITHRYGYVTNYSHMQRLAVTNGEYVKKGQIIGYVGNTGRSTGYHLHYEVRVGDSAIDPAQFLYLDKFYR